MNINKTVLKIRQNWINKLNRSDAEYFIDPGTMKDMALYRTLLHIRGRGFDSENELALHLCRYLQILMVMAGVSGDKRDEVQFKNFLHVPFHCEDITRFNSYRPELDTEGISLEKIKSYPLPEFWESGAKETEKILKSSPVKIKPMIEEVLSYYSTPVVAMALVERDIYGPHYFLMGLQSLLLEILRKHYPEEKGNTKRVEDFIQGIKFIINLESGNLKKSG